MLSQLGRPRHRVWGGALGLASLLALTLAACGGGGGANTGPAQGTPVTNANATSTVNCGSFQQSQAHLVSPNELTIASDTTYAPAEFNDPNNPTQFDGFDMDLIREVARRLCLGPNIVQVGFSTIIPNISGPALGQQPWDLSISAFSINSSRTKIVDMIPYAQAGESTLVQTGNPQHIQSFADFCGKAVSAQNGTIELAELQAANGQNIAPDAQGVPQAPVCKSHQIQILSFDSEEDVINQVITGRAVASYQDQPVTDYYISLNPGKLDHAFTTTNSVGPYGIVVRKDNQYLENAVRTVMRNMQSDGTYTRILKAWGATDLAFPTPAS